MIGINQSSLNFRARLRSPCFEFGFGALESNQIQTEKEGLTYKIKDLEIKIMDGDKVFNRLKFINAKPKIGDSLSFGLSRTMVSGKIIGVADAAPF